MNDGKTLRQHLSEERNKLKQMNFREKRQHIWEYYKFHLLLLCVVLFVLYSFINWLVNPPPRDYMYIAWLGPQVLATQISDLNDLLSPIVANPARERVTVTNYAASGDMAINAAMQTRFAAMLQTAGIDAIITTSEGLHDLDDVGWIRPLDDILPYLPYINERFYTFPDGRIMAVLLTHSPLLEAAGFDTYDLYITLVTNSRRANHVASGIKELLR